MVEVKDVKKYKKATKDLIEAVKNRVKEVCGDYDEDNHLEDDFNFEYNGVSYGLIEVDETDWDDQGKYQYQNVTYQLVSYDANVGWIRDIIDEFDLFLVLPVQRSGSYFSDYYYNYNIPYVKIAKIKHVPEQIIPAHDEVEFVTED